MAQDVDVNELIEDTLSALLTDQLDRHVPADDRVGIHTGWIGYAGPGAVYPDVLHRLQQLTRSVGDSHIICHARSTRRHPGHEPDRRRVN